MRCFIAIELPEEIRDFAAAAQKSIMEKNLVDARYTDRKSLHLTLKFLGEIDGATIKKVENHLKKIKTGKFTIGLESTGTFMQEGETKIIWHALTGEGLIMLQKSVDDCLKDLFAPEERFMAHVTIARVRHDINQEKLLSFLKRIDGMDGKFEIAKFCLMKSTPTKEGSKYETLAEYELECRI